jgi:hypothetical protein
MVQLAGHDMLKARGVTLIAASAPTFFVEDTPTAVLVRQVLGAVAEFEKTTLVAKLAAARRRKRTATGKKVEGRKSHAEKRHDRRWHGRLPEHDACRAVRAVLVFTGGGSVYQLGAPSARFARSSNR